MHTCVNSGSVRSELENFSGKSAAGALTGGIATAPKTAGEGTGGTVGPQCGPYKFDRGDQ